MQYKNYYQKDDFNVKDDTDYTVNNDINHNISPSVYESDYTIGSVKKQIKRSHLYEDDTMPIQSADEIMPGSNSEGIGKSIVAFCFALISVFVILLIARLYGALKTTLAGIPLFSNDNTDFSAGVIGSQCYIYIGLSGLFFLISLILSVLSIKLFAKGGTFGNSKPVATLVFAILSLVVSVVAVILTALLLMGAPVLL